MQSDSVSLFISAWRQMTGRLPAPIHEVLDGIACCFSDVPNPFFNLWVQRGPAKDTDQFEAILQVGAEQASASPNPVGGILRTDWLPADWEAQAQHHGLVPMVPMTSMECDHLLPPRRPAPPMDIVRVSDDQGARDLAMLNAAAYAMPEALFECIATSNFWPTDCHGFVGYVDGQPVSSAAALPVEDTVYIALVATHPDRQGKGYAEAVMRHAIEAGQQAMGVTRSTLHASEAGKPLYAAMGYTSGPKLILVGKA